MTAAPDEDQTEEGRKDSEKYGRCKARIYFCLGRVSEHPIYLRTLSPILAPAKSLCSSCFKYVVKNNPKDYIKVACSCMASRQIRAHTLDHVRALQTIASMRLTAILVRRSLCRSIKCPQPSSPTSMSTGLILCLLFGNSFPLVRVCLCAWHSSEQTKRSDDGSP